MRVYLGIIGKSFAGKETVYKIIKELIKTLAPDFTVSIHHFSDPLNEILDILCLPKERPNQQKLSTVLRQNFDEELLGNVLVKRAQTDSASIVCLDGIRRPQDVIKLRNLPNSHLVFVDTQLEKRFERGQTRKDRPVQTREQFMAQQGAETESKIDEIAQAADIVLDNSGTIENLRAQIMEKILAQKLKIIKE